jgi:hypothetical protein
VPVRAHDNRIRPVLLGAALQDIGHREKVRFQGFAKRVKPAPLQMIVKRSASVGRRLEPNPDQVGVGVEVNHDWVHCRLSWHQVIAGRVAVQCDISNGRPA